MQPQLSFADVAQAGSGILTGNGVKGTAGTLFAIVCIFQLWSIVETLVFRKQLTGQESQEEDYWENVKKDQAKQKMEQKNEKTKTDFEARARARASGKK